jgi:hypothetical protein
MPAVGQASPKQRPEENPETNDQIGHRHRVFGGVEF